MDKLERKLREISKKVANYDPALESKINETVNTMTNPKIESFVKPQANVNVIGDGTIHSFMVEIKSSKNGPIPDTKLMSRIIEAVESGETSEFSNVNQLTDSDSNKFEVISFKYERKDDKKKQ